MQTKITGALAFLLLAGASQAALAQDHDRSQPADRPHAQQEHAPAAQPHAAAPAPAPGPQAPQGARFAPPPGSGPQMEHAGPDGRQHGGPDHFAHDDGPGPAPGPNGRGDRHWDHGGPPPDVANPGGRHWDRPDAPRETPRPGEHGWDRDHDGHQADRHWDGRRGPPEHWEHWERGRYPPVYWAERRFRLDPYRAPYGFYVRTWGFGDFLPRGWFAEPYWLNDFYDYDLPYPPPGYEWVRVGGDALLVDRYTGRIVQVVRGIFW